MVKEIRWTHEAAETFDRVIEYLQENWTDREVERFLNATNLILRHISLRPKMFRRGKMTNVHEALITPHNLLIYKIYPERIDLLIFWDTRQNPRRKKY